MAEAARPIGDTERVAVDVVLPRGPPPAVVDRGLKDVVAVADVGEGRGRGRRAPRSPGRTETGRPVTGEDPLLLRPAGQTETVADALS